MDVAEENQPAPSAKKRKRKNAENKEEFSNTAISNGNCNWKIFQQQKDNQNSKEPAKQPTGKQRGSTAKKRKRKNDENKREFANITVSNDNCNWKSFQQKILKSESSKKPAKQPTVPHHTTKMQETKKRHPPRISEKKTTKDLPARILKGSGSTEVTDVVAIDCEMVGVDTGNDSILARISIVNKYGNCIYDKYVKPTEHVVDYRTHVSGIRPKDLLNAETFETVQREVAEILKGRILVGHALKNDLKVLYLSHPRRCIRDTSRYKGFRKLIKGGTPSLKKLAKELLGVTIQEGEHDSVVDARTTMQLYILYKKEWERAIRSKHKGVFNKTGKQDKHNKQTNKNNT